MKILVGCEESGTLRDILRDFGHDAWSNDLEGVEPRGKYPNYHLYGDVRWFLDGTGCPVDKWDMLIAFPPCTHLCVSGARWFKHKHKEQRAALQLIRDLMAAPISKKAFENPVGIISTKIRKPDQIIQPWQFGHGETKATCIWVDGLPLLRPTKIVSGRKPVVHYMSPGPNRARDRSKTYPGIARAMARQWAGKIGGFKA